MSWGFLHHYSDIDLYLDQHIFQAFIKYIRYVKIISRKVMFLLMLLTCEEYPANFVSP